MGLAQIDGFRAIAQRLGEDAANVALREVAGLVRSQLRDIDIAGRFESGEIGYILPETDKVSGHIAAERLRARIEKAVLAIGEAEYSLTLTIGYAALPSDTMNAYGLLACARGACAAAASVGINHVLGFRG